MPKGLKGFQKGHQLGVGKILSKAHKAALRKANLGVKKDDAFREKCRLRQLGKKLSKETIKRMVESRKWYKPTQETNRKQSVAKLGSRNPMYGKKPSKEHRLKISESLKQTLGRTRDISFQELLHEIRHSPKYKMWRDRVFVKDMFIYIWCGYAKGKILNADHIKPFILIIRQNNIKTFDEAMACEELWEVSNGRTLCKPCHQLTDTWGNKAKLWS